MSQSTITSSARKAQSKHTPKRLKLPAPLCPCCGDQYNVMALVHEPDRLFCLAIIYLAHQDQKRAGSAEK